MVICMLLGASMLSLSTEEPVSNLPRTDFFVDVKRANSSTSTSTSTSSRMMLTAGPQIPHRAGTFDDPFGSLLEAVEAVRKVPFPHRCGATVTIAGGVYGGLTNSLQLTEEDSGCEGAPVVYRAATGEDDDVVVHGGVELSPHLFKKGAQTREGLTIWTADLSAIGLRALAGTSGHFQTQWVCANGNRSATPLRLHAVPRAYVALEV